MEKIRQEQVLKAIISQLEDSSQAATFEMRICDKIKDVKGYEAAKTRALDLESRISAANDILKELTAEAVGK
jgi:hypothetical protein